MTRTDAEIPVAVSVSVDTSIAQYRTALENIIKAHKRGWKLDTWIKQAENVLEGNDPHKGMYFDCDRDEWRPEDQ